MKFLEELKAAQEVIDKWQDIKKLFYYSENTSAPVITVLRRIPQLIEVVEWIEEKLAEPEQEVAIGSHDCLDQPDYGPCRMTLDLLISKLEGKK